MTSKRKHTPITSDAQTGLFGAELRRRRQGQAGTMPGITTAELSSHLHEAAGKDLPQYSAGPLARAGRIARKKKKQPGGWTGLEKGDRWIS